MGGGGGEEGRTVGSVLYQEENTWVCRVVDVPGIPPIGGGWPLFLINPD